ncbi:ribonuclease H-like domain-containing protein [Bacillus spongiae]|uniref:Ribonuclease H-like domain-containing protein n=1 Tax=Bacillus spongiae TaxID=2683610 RepID=A0ABU8HD22_9BACI
MSLKNKLNRMKPHIQKKDGGKYKEKVIGETKERLAIPYWDDWKKENAQLYKIDQQFCIVKESTYPISYRHGRHAFQELKEVIEAWQSFNGHHPLSARGLDSDDLFFFDTETTGLGGGVGNVIFLLGYAQVQGDNIIVRQHVLPSPGNEIALYHSFLENIDYTTLVTYNGKAFDWPQVKTRHTLVRDHVPKLPSFGHFDLYHASRRMWKHKIESVKLQNVEREVLDFYRKEDVPGYLAPMIYYDFVEHKNPQGMIKVLKHNEEDILSLISLYITLSKQILQLDHGQTDYEKLQVGEWFHYLGEKNEAFSTFQELKGKKSEISLPAIHRLAYHLKRSGEYDKAKAYWEKVSKEGSGKLHYEALLELAKLYEHQYKDLHAAIRCCREMQHSPLRKEEQLEKRLARLKRKYEKKFPG